MSCKKFHELISVEINGLLNNEELTMLNEHCKDCVSCRKKRINTTNKGMAKSNLPVNTNKKLRFKIIILLFFIITVLCISMVVASIYKKPAAKTSAPDNLKVEISENEDNTYPAKATEQPEQTETETSASSYKPTEQLPEPVVPYIPDIPVASPYEITEPQPEQIEPENEEPVIPEKPEEQTENDIEEASPEKDVESISLISSETSRADVFNAISAASPRTETVSADSDFQLELTSEEFSAVVDYLNNNGTEFVISKVPETTSVSASFVFKEVEEDNLHQEEVQPEPEQPFQTPQDDMPPEENTALPEETIQTENITNQE